MLGSVDEPAPSADANPNESELPAAERPSTPSAAGRQTPPVARVLAVALGYILLGTVLGAVGTRVVRGSPVAGRHFWNFDDVSAKLGATGEGWGSNEHDETGLTFRWCAALRCSLRLVVSSDILSGDGEMLLSARMWPFRYPGVAVPQQVRLRVNGEVIGEHTLPDTISTETFHVRPGLLRPGPNDVALEFAYAKSPKQAGTNLLDERPLAAAVDWLELDPVR